MKKEQATKVIENSNRVLMRVWVNDDIFRYVSVRKKTAIKIIKEIQDIYDIDLTMDNRGTVTIGDNSGKYIKKSDDSVCFKSR